MLGVLVTMDGAQGVRALQLIQPKEAIPIHYADYGVFKEPLSTFKDAVAGAGLLATTVRYLAHGESYRFELDRYK